MNRKNYFVLPGFAMSGEQAVGEINDLIDICYDGKIGYTYAAQHVTDSELKGIFADYAKQRDAFASELANLLVSWEAEPVAARDDIDSLNEGWTNIRSAADDGVVAILEECEASEDATMEAYNELLEETLPDDVRRVVHAQYEYAQRAHDHIRELRNKARS